MFDTLLKDAFSFLASNSLEELKALKAQYNNQHILYLTIKQFSESNLFRTEYRNIAFNNLKDDIMSISSCLITPTLDLQTITENISPILAKCFVTDDENAKTHIAKSISMQYITKSNLAVSLLDLAHQQREDTEKILSSISDLKPELSLIAKTVISQNAKKELALQKGINRKINSFIHSAVHNFILVTTKASPVARGMVDKKGELHQYMDTIQDLIDTQFPDIDGEYYTKPIHTFTIDKEDPFIPKQLEIDVFKMLSVYKKELYVKVDELLKYTQVLPDDFFLSMIELMDYMDANINYSMYDHGFSDLFKQAKPAENFNMVQFIKNEYTKLGQLILNFKKYI